MNVELLTVYPMVESLAILDIRELQSLSYWLVALAGLGVLAWVFLESGKSSAKCLQSPIIRQIRPKLKEGADTGLQVSAPAVRALIAAITPVLVKQIKSGGITSHIYSVAHAGELARSIVEKGVAATSDRKSL